MVDREDRREDIAASTAMFRAFVQRRDADSSTEQKKTRGVAVWIVAAVVIVAAVAILAAVLG